MFSKKLEKLLSEAKKNGITAQNLADKLEVKKSRITDWKKGRCSPTPDVIAKIAKFFNVPADYLLKTDEEDQNEHNIKNFGNSNTVIIGSDNQVSSNIMLTQDEAEFLKVYRSLTPAQRSAFTTLLKTIK